MRRVVPSQVVAAIDQMFNWAETQVDHQSAAVSLGLNDSNRLTAIVDMVEQIPGELINLDGPSYARLTAALAAIRNTLRIWYAMGNVFALRNVEGFGELNPVALVRRALAQCPDEAPSPGTSELAFITDAGLRDSLRIDISEAYRAYTDGSWKAATVLAGSALEALLLWALQRNAGGATASAAALVTAGTIRNPGPNLERWNLHDYIEVAKHLTIITDKTAAQDGLTKDFRNLIHPGVAARAGLLCDKATALSALAGLEHTIRELAP
jgi:hypothetical protein